MRYVPLDSLRGIMLVSMVLSHLGGGLPVGVTQGLVLKTAFVNDAASGFVFLSGLTVGLVYVSGWVGAGNEERRRALGARMRLVFLHNAFLAFFGSVLAVLALYGGREVGLLEPYGTAPLLFGLFTSLALAGGWYLNILPMYVLFLLLTPLAFSAIANGRRSLVLVAVLAAWLLGQTGLLQAGWDMLDGVLGLESHGIETGLYFNQLSWSALYFIGLLVGSAFARREFDLAILKHARCVPIFVASVVAAVGTTILLSLYLHRVVVAHFEQFVWLVSKANLGALALLNFVAVAFAVAWLLVAGPSSRFQSIRVAGWFLDRLLHWRPLVLLGQHSLTVFSYHIVGVYLFYTLVDPAAFNAWTANLVLAVGILSMAIPVQIERRTKERRRRALAAVAQAA